MNNKTIERLELNKILLLCSEYAVLEKTKESLQTLVPYTEKKEAEEELELTEECTKALFSYGIGRVEYFSPFFDELERAKKGSTLSCGELLKCCSLLRSCRIIYKGINSINDDSLVSLKRLCENIYYDEALEEDIQTKILNETDVSDYASDKLYSIRKEIRALNERIRSRLASFLTGTESKFLQDGIITMRDNRYVLPVRTEYKRSIKGFIHDKSASGSTVFIEPEEVLEMNNELRSLAIDEKEEVERILSELSHRVGFMSDKLTLDIDLLVKIDSCFARAEYGYKCKGIRPKLNDKGFIKIVKGRHPLIDEKKVVPVSLSIGENYRFLLISGPNTGGKTVTLKMTGLFCLMAACGLFLPATYETEVSIFKKIYCDVGDSQSIEENLSTFSSHIKNIIEISDGADENSLVLIDELGGGTDPEEGQALAQAVITHLLQKNSFGIVTTHFTALKEYAYAQKGIENASMEFDSSTLQPLYNIKIGLPGSSNALSICRRLGLNANILKMATENLSEGAKSFENILHNAEDTRLKAEQTLQEATLLQSDWKNKLDVLTLEREKLEKEKEKFYLKAKAESKRIINDRTAEAEEILSEIEKIFAQESISESDIIKARTLKNKLSDKAYETQQEERLNPQYVPIEGKLKEGDNVYIITMNCEGIVLSVQEKKKEAEVQCNNIKFRIKISNLLKVLQPTLSQKKEKNKNISKKEKVSVIKNVSSVITPLKELNVVGMTVQEALPEIDAFIDNAILSNLDEIKIVHGYGTGKLRAGIHEYLRKHRNVEEFRQGKYGEGEGGVTIVKIK